MLGLFFILELLISTTSTAGTCPFGTKLFYGNGMFNSNFEALKSTSELSKVGLTMSDPLAAPHDFELAYNRNESKMLNVLSAVVQKLNINRSNT